MTLAELLATFPDEESCRQHLAKMRWPDGKVRCPRCGLPFKVYARKAGYRWTCKHCNKNGYGFSLTTGTIFEDTKVPLRMWFQVIYLMLRSKKGMSALQIQGMIGVKSYETAWYMCHRVRAAMKNDEFRLLMGEVEVDETLIGGLEENKHRSKRTGDRGHKGKIKVIGAIARKGNVVAKVIERADSKTLNRFVRETVSNRVSLLATDDFTGYKRLPATMPHETVNHQSGEYVRGVIHTNNIESFWSILKRGMVGSFHHVSKDYLPLYINEFTFRHNHRREPEVMFDRLLGSC